MYCDVQIISKGHDDFGDLLRKLSGGSKDQSLGYVLGVIDFLKNTDGEGGSLSCSWLSLRNDISVLEDRHDGPLLDSGRPFKTLKKSQLRYWKLELTVCIYTP